MRRGVELALEVAAVVFVLSMVAGQVLGQPVLLSYVTTGSMEPTLQPGDGFVAIPAQVAGPVEEGDVVTFRAEELNGGGLTTHRVVGETERGYITKGDANPFPDQDGSEPPVKESQIVAVAWQPGGSVLAIPGVGTLVTGSQAALSEAQRQLAILTGSRSFLGAQGIATVLFLLTLVAYVLDVLFGGGGGSRDRSRERSREDGFDPRLVMAGLALLVVLSATAAMVVPAGTQKYTIVSAESDSPGPRVIEQGTSESFPYRVANGGVVPVVAYVEPGSDGVSVENGSHYVPGRSVRNATVTLSAPPDTGAYRRFVTEYRYLAVLPGDTIRTLHEIHPWLALLVIDGLLGGSFFLVGAALVGRGRVRSRERRRPRGTMRRLRRLLT